MTQDERKNSTTVIIDYGVGNLGSIANMLKKIGAQAIVSSKATEIEKADKLILLGVGAFDNGIKNLTELELIPMLNDKVTQEKTPILDICLGMQLLVSKSEEGNLDGLGWIDAKAVKFKFESSQLNLKYRIWAGTQLKPVKKVRCLKICVLTHDFISSPIHIM